MSTVAAKCRIDAMVLRTWPANRLHVEPYDAGFLSGTAWRLFDINRLLKAGLDAALNAAQIVEITARIALNPNRSQIVTHAHKHVMTRPKWLCEHDCEGYPGQTKG